METIKKNHLIGHDKEGNAIWLTVKREHRYNRDEWSFTGIIGPTARGNAKSCGQIIDDMPEKIQKIWNKYHMNGMSAGTEAQDAIIEEYRKMNPEWRYSYEEACNILKERGLYEDGEYKYGHGWKHHANPNSPEILHFFENLRDDT